jgi:hypothetical protein
MTLYMPLSYLLRAGVLAATSLLCLTLLTACENKAPADQLTVVEGTVSSASSGRPLPGVLMAIQSYHSGAFGPVSYQLTSDSVRTDANGRYRLQFTNTKGLYYVVSFDPVTAPAYRPSRYVFAGGIVQPSPVGPEGHPDLGSLTLGRTNIIDFKPQ